MSNMLVCGATASTHLFLVVREQARDLPTGKLSSIYAAVGEPWREDGAFGLIARRFGNSVFL